MTSEAKGRRSPWLSVVLRFPLTRILAAAVAILLALNLVRMGVAWLSVSLELPRPAHWLALSVLLALATHFTYAGYVRLMERRNVAELAHQGAAPELGRGLLIGGALLLGSLGAMAALGYVSIDATHPWTAMFIAFGAALQASYVEEVLFRGVLFRIVEESLGTWLALAISAAIFGFAHFANPDATLLGLLAITVEAGILLGAAYVLTRRLWLAIGIHFAWNFVQQVFGLSPLDVGTVFESRLNGPELLIGDASGMESSMIAVTLCLAVAVLLLVKAHRKGHFIRPFWARATKELQNQAVG